MRLTEYRGSAKRLSLFCCLLIGLLMMIAPALSQADQIEAGSLTGPGKGIDLYTSGIAAKDDSGQVSGWVYLGTASGGTLWATVTELSIQDAQNGEMTAVGLYDDYLPATAHWHDRAGQVRLEIVGDDGTTYESIPAGVLQSGVLVLTPPANAPPPPLPSVQIDHIVPNDDSAKIYIVPVPGAKDYRVYDRANPHFTKYAGGPGNSALLWMPTWTEVTSGIWDWVTSERPLPCIEFNGLKGGEQLVVEAVDQPGPYMDMHGAPMPPCTEPDCKGVNDPNCNDVESVNGHGDPSSHPKAIARSTAFSVTLEPRTLSGEQAFFDNFRASSEFLPSTPDPRTKNGDAIPYRVENDKWTSDAYLMWDRLGETKVFTDHGHLMTVAADGGKVWYDQGATQFAGGTAYATMALHPKASADISGGKVLHITGEWDAHNSGRRWQDVFIIPKGDALTQPAWREFAICPTYSHNAIIADVSQTNVQVTQFDALKGSPGWMSSGQLIGRYVAGFSGTEGWENMPSFRCTANQPGVTDRGHNSWANGHDNDNDSRHRFDIYLSTTRMQVYEEGVLKVNYLLPVPLVYTQLEVYFAQQFYHSALEHYELFALYTEREDLWIYRTPFTDQRHWDNLGFEVLKSFPH